jgi:hypothetical protein
MILQNLFTKIAKHQLRAATTLHMQHPDFVDIRPPTDDSDHNTPLGDNINDNDDWYDDLPDLS